MTILDVIDVARAPQMGRCTARANASEARTALVGTIGLALAVLAPSTTCAAPENGPADSLKLVVQGEIPKRCGFKTAPLAVINLGVLDDGGSVEIPFVVDCNTGYRIRMQSERGALEAAQASSVFPNRLAYDVSVYVGTDGADLTAGCASENLRSGGCQLHGAVVGSGGLSSGDAISIDEAGALKLEWQAPASVLTAGSYSDTLTIVVEGRS
jgi:hypothetical protein